MDISEVNMYACELNSLSPTDNDVTWVYSNHGYICSSAVVKERLLVSFSNQVDDSFAFWSLQDIPNVKKFKLNGECEKELAAVAVCLQLSTKKFSSKNEFSLQFDAGHYPFGNCLTSLLITLGAVHFRHMDAKFLLLHSDSSILMLVNNWEAVRILNGEMITYDGTMKKTCANFVKRYAARKGMQVRYKFARSTNEVINCLKECDVKRFKDLTSTLNTTKLMPRDDCFTFL